MTYGCRATAYPYEIGGFPFLRFRGGLRCAAPSPLLRHAYLPVVTTLFSLILENGGLTRRRYGRLADLVSDGISTGVVCVEPGAPVALARPTPSPYGRSTNQQ